MTGTPNDLRDIYSTLVWRDTDGRVEIVVRGAVDACTREHFAAAVGGGLTAGPTHLAIDLRRTTFFSLSALAVLLAAERQAAASGASFELRTDHGLTRRLLRYAATLG